MSLLDGALVLVAIVAALWWACSRHRGRAPVGLLSIAALFLAAVVLVVDGVQWQLVPWQELAAAFTAAAYPSIRAEAGTVGVS